MKKTAFCLMFVVALRASAFIGASLKLQLRNASNVAADWNHHGHYLIQRQIEALDYNDPKAQVKPQVSPSGFWITNLSVANGSATLSWQQGTPPFQIWATPAFGGVFGTLGNSTLARTVTFPVSQNQFWRVQAQVPSVLTLNGNTQPRLNWTAPDTDMSDSLTPFIVEKSVDNGSNWSAITGSPFAIGVRSANDSTTPPVIYRIRETTTTGVKVPYNMPSLDVPQVPGTVSWVFPIGGVDVDYCGGVSVDNSGSIIVTGTFSQTVDFDPAHAGSSSIITSSGYWDIFVAKYNSARQFVWVKRFGSAGVNDISTQLVTDSSGNIFVAVSTVLGSYLKLDSSGNQLWIKGPIPVGGQSLNTHGMTIDSAGNLIVAGDFHAQVGSPGGLMDFGEGHIGDSGNASNASFLVKYGASTGICLWLDTFYDLGDPHRGYGVAVDKRINPSTGLPYDQIVFVGTIQGQFQIESGVWIYDHGSTGSAGYIARFDSNGVVIPGSSKALNVGSPGNNSCKATAVCIDSLGNVIIIGTWNGQQNFGGATTILNQSPGGSGFFLKLNSLFQHIYDKIWSCDLAYSHTCSPTLLMLDSTDNAICAGTFTRTVEFENTVLTSAFDNADRSDVFVTKYRPDGGQLWCKQFGGTDNDSVAGIALASNARIVVGGGFSNNLNGSIVSFGGFPVPSHGLLDAFLMGLNP